MKSHYYSQHAVALRAELGGALSRGQMREFHEKSAWRHLLVAARQFAILAVATWALVRFENPLIWIPLAIVQGFTVIVAGIYVLVNLLVDLSYAYLDPRIRLE